MTRILIFANGVLPESTRAVSLFSKDDRIIAADGGTRLALSLGVTPQIVIGDLDSISAGDLQRLRERNVEILPHPPEKDETDLELALANARNRDPHQIVIIGGVGGRLDHTLANLALLTDERFDGVDLRFDDGVEEVLLCRVQVEIRGKAGDLVSLIPWGVEVTGVTTRDLEWPLKDETLYPHRTRGVSNRMLTDRAVVQIGSGTLLVIHRRVP